jgi:methionyl-tRNA synthetase
VPKTDKLLKLTVNTGAEQRTVVSGIAHCYEPEQVIGQQVTLLANLEPRKIKGIESKGMILMAEDTTTGKLIFVQAKDLTKEGSRIS